MCRPRCKGGSDGCFRALRVEPVSATPVARPWRGHGLTERRPSPEQVREGRVVGRPLEEAPQVVAVSLEGPTAVAGQERRSSKLGVIDQVLGLWPMDRGT
jgi:hypothetical protein